MGLNNVVILRSNFFLFFFTFLSVYSYGGVRNIHLTTLSLHYVNLFWLFLNAKSGI